MQTQAGGSGQGPHMAVRNILPLPKLGITWAVLVSIEQGPHHHFPPT